MGRGRSFSIIEEQILLDNYDKTIVELEALLLENGYRRSRKSINRKLEKLRDEGKIGFRSTDTIRRSYRQRMRKNNINESVNIRDEFRGDEDYSGFDTGIGWEDDEE